MLRSELTGSLRSQISWRSRQSTSQGGHVSGSAFSSQDVSALGLRLPFCRTF